MKVQIRNNIFETNSSSVHSITISTEKEYSDFSKGKLWFKDDWDDEKNKEKCFLPKQEAIEYNIKKMLNTFDLFKEEEYKKVLDEYKKSGCLLDAFTKYNLEDEYFEIEDEISIYDYYFNYDEYWDKNQYETFETKYTSPSGDKIVAWGYYGQEY